MASPPARSLEPLSKPSLRRTALLIAISAACGPACGSPARAEGDRAADRAEPPPVAVRPALETELGVADRGLWGDLDAQIRLPPPSTNAGAITAAIDLDHEVLVVEAGGWPVKVYPLSRGGAAWTLGAHTLRLRAGDRVELGSLLRADNVRALSALPRQGRAAALAGRGDRDDDGIPDTLDVLIGAKKTVLNADAYTGGYVSIKYPMGDVPRTIGVCTDVIVRALRNAGVDLQRDLHEDIQRSKRSYPMVKGKGDPNIDHRRVKTLLPLLLRAWQRHTPAFDDPEDPLRPGDIVLMDTFPSRSGPDHIGIVSDQLGPSGLPLIINNWTDGTVTAEMDLLTFVPVTHRFRVGPKG